MGHIILITGGARSGKSSFAEQLASEGGVRVAYIATAQALDAEMEDRIFRHREQRPWHWKTCEAHQDPSSVLTEAVDDFDVFLLDCLTVLITNRLLAADIDWERPAMNQLHAAEADVMGEIDAIITAALAGRACTIVVSNEVGLGIVPLTPLARFFRDCAGRANQRIAAVAGDVYLVVSGIPVRIKGG